MMAVVSGRMMMGRENELVGHVWVDSGCVVIADPCRSKQIDDEVMVEGSSVLQDLTIKSKFGEYVKDDMNQGIVFSQTSIGDGVFPVIAQLEDGMVRSLSIIFS